MRSQLDSIEDEYNGTPIDTVEDVLSANNWKFDRINDEELLVDISGKTGSYKLFFIWQQDMSALQFCAQLNQDITPGNRPTAQKAILKLNEDLWMGHFDIPEVTGKPCFRHTALIPQTSRASVMDMIENLVDVALAQCERHYPLFALLASANDLDDQVLSLAVMDTVGES